MPAGTRAFGDFCWMNMLTARPAEAREFFARLLGWTYVELPGMGHRVQVGGRDIGGLYDVEGPNAPPGLSPVVGVMVRVESADSIAARVKALGGKAPAVFDVMDQGRIAVCYDLEGANIDVWEPKSSAGSDADSRLHGAPSWFELAAAEPARSATFYAEVFGWAPKFATAAQPPYTTFALGVQNVAGMTPLAASSKSHWSTYFTVDDVEAAARLAQELGATVTAPIRETPGVGRFCGITSPQGVPFVVIEYAK